MATSTFCNSIGSAATDKLGRLVHQGASLPAEGSLLHLDCKKSIKRTDDDHGGHLRSSSSRFASIAVAATAWAGLSMCGGPVDALTMAYEGEHQNVGESVIFTPTSMLHLAGYVKLPGDFIMMGEFNEEQGANVEMEATIGKVPSIKPPNEGSNSPWVPKINGPKKTAFMRCPKWTESELEMVLPDFQGWPKPFPRMQGHLYPFWPATASIVVDKGDALDTHERTTLLSSPTPPPQQPHLPIKKLPSCFTM